MHEETNIELESIRVVAFIEEWKIHGARKGELPMKIWKEQYKELEKAALSADATQEDINRLGEWFERFGMDYWNGEFYDIDGVHKLWSIDEEDEDGDFRHIGWEVR